VECGEALDRGRVQLRVGAGLLYRVYDEALAVEDGYYNRYWFMMPDNIEEDIASQAKEVTESFVFDFEKVEAFAAR